MNKLKKLGVDHWRLVASIFIASSGTLLIILIASFANSKQPLYIGLFSLLLGFYFAIFFSPEALSSTK